MRLKNKLRSDRAGVNPLLIAVVVIVVVVVIAVAAYFLLSSDNNNESGDIIAPGTTVTADITDSGVTYQYQQSFIGQNANDYFIMETSSLDPSAVPDYYLEPKKEANGVPDGAVKVGEGELDTGIDGTKNLEIWRYETTDGSGDIMEAYLDPTYKWLVYQGTITHSDGTVSTYTLTDYNMVLQSSYKESSSIGVTYGYTFTYGTQTYPAGVVCVAECLNGQYGMMYDFSAIYDGLYIYDVSDNIQGLPVDAVNTGQTSQLDTMDGTVNTQIWTITENGNGVTFYYGPSTHILYRLVITGTTADGIVLDLTSKP